MKKILLLTVVVLLATGCTSEIHQEDIAKARYFCTDKQGIFNYEVLGAITWVTCRNGTTQDVSFVKTKEK